MYGTYYSTYSTDFGPHIAAPADASSYLPHSYYLSMVISELCTLDRAEYHISIADISDRIDHLINYVHDDDELKAITRQFFSRSENIRDILYTMEDSGLLHIRRDQIYLSAMQLDYIRDYLLEYH